MLLKKGFLYRVQTCLLIALFMASSTLRTLLRLERGQDSTTVPTSGEGGAEWLSWQSCTIWLSFNSDSVLPFPLLRVTMSLAPKIYRSPILVALLEAVLCRSWEPWLGSWDIRVRIWAPSLAAVWSWENYSFFLCPSSIIYQYGVIKAVGPNS